VQLSIYPPLRLAAALLITLSTATPATASTVSDAVQSALQLDPRYPLHLATRAIAEGYREQAGALPGGCPRTAIVARARLAEPDFVQK